MKICRLRLWIELLKNAYYTAESNYTYLETLPNIDINIKCGNSLLHRFALTDSIQTVLRESSISISQYKEAVAKYKNAQVKAKAGFGNVYNRNQVETENRDQPPGCTIG